MNFTHYIQATTTNTNSTDWHLKVEILTKFTVTNIRILQCSYSLSALKSEANINMFHGSRTNSYTVRVGTFHILRNLFAYFQTPHLSHVFWLYHVRMMLVTPRSDNSSSHVIFFVQKPHKILIILRNLLQPCLVIMQYGRKINPEIPT